MRGHSRSQNKPDAGSEACQTIIGAGTEKQLVIKLQKPYYGKFYDFCALLELLKITVFFLVIMKNMHLSIF